MGLKFCNEAIIALEEIWPARKEEIMPLSPLQVSSLIEIKISENNNNALVLIARI